jgi:hypothetical protein
VRLRVQTSVPARVDRRRVEKLALYCRRDLVDEPRPECR